MSTIVPNKAVERLVLLPKMNNVASVSSEITSLNNHLVMNQSKCGVKYV